MSAVLNKIIKIRFPKDDYIKLRIEASERRKSLSYIIREKLEIKEVKRG